MTSIFSGFRQFFASLKPSNIVAKFAFLPPAPTYSIVRDSNGDREAIIFKPEAGHINEDIISDLEVFYTTTKLDSRIACLYIPFRESCSRGLSSSTTINSDQPVSNSRLYTVFFSHGNAVDLGQLVVFLYSFSRRFQVNVFSYDYSGYGASSGQAIEETVYVDAEAAFAELRSRYACPLNKIILYGQSVGTAPTVEVATRNTVAGVILHSPLMSGSQVIFPSLKSSLPFDSFTNIDKVNSITSRTLIIHGTEDRVINIKHGRSLHKLLPHPLEPLWVDGAGHNDIDRFSVYFDRLNQFFSKDLLSSPSI